MSNAGRELLMVALIMALLGFVGGLLAGWHISADPAVSAHQRVTEWFQIPDR